jgi:hypothetical protein
VRPDGLLAKQIDVPAGHRELMALVAPLNGELSAMIRCGGAPVGTLAHL